MKSVTEFPNHKLADGIKAKAALSAEGKTPEEITTAMGEQFKLEGDRLKCFLTAVDIAGQSSEKLFRIKVVKLNEGQSAPARGTIIEELCYITELQTNPADLKKAQAEAAAAQANAKDGGRGGKGGGKGGDRGGRQGGGKGGGKPKASPWGVSPEEVAAKKEAARQAAREKSLAGKS